MTNSQKELIKQAKDTALDVMRHNSKGSHKGLPRTAGWGYPEPYTRDWLISSLGILASKDELLIKTLRRVLETLAKNQSPLGHIPSLVNNSTDRGSSDATPLFIMALVLYRNAVGEKRFLDAALTKSVRWMEYQSPANLSMVAQMPTSDWRDEQWVIGYGLYVNTIVYIYLRLMRQSERALDLQETMDRFTVPALNPPKIVREGFSIKERPYYALWTYKIYQSERFDLLGNSLAIISGLASPVRARKIIKWIENQIGLLKSSGDLAVDMPPNLFPYIRPQDSDWMPRYERYNRPGEYHNGGIWPFICGFYIAALVKAKQYKLAEKRLLTLTELIKPAKEADVKFGFNEWLKAQDGRPKGEDWQTWSAAIYYYAACCVEQKRTIFFDKLH